MPNPGDVFNYANFPFPEGNIRNKYFVVLNEVGSEDASECLALITTSRLEHYHGATKGCYQEEAVFIILGGEAGFTKSTAIKMPSPKRSKIYVFTLSQLLILGMSKVVEQSGKLSEQRFRELMNCLKKFKDDIAPEHWKILFPK